MSIVDLNLDTQVKGSRPPYFGTDSGTTNAYAVTTVAPLGPSLRTGSVIIFVASNANTGASTLQVLGGPLGPSSLIPIKKNVSTALAANDILANQVVEVIYDGTNFQLPTALVNNQPTFSDAETPSGSGTSYSLAHSPSPAASLMLSVDGQVMTAGASADYTLSGASITFATAPRSGADIRAWYRY